MTHPAGEVGSARQSKEEKKDSTGDEGAFYNNRKVATVLFSQPCFKSKILKNILSNMAAAVGRKMKS